MFTQMDVQRLDAYIKHLLSEGNSSIDAIELFKILKNQFHNPNKEKPKIVTAQSIAGLKSILQRLLCKKLHHNYSEFIAFLSVYLSISNFDPKRQFFQLKQQFRKNLYKSLFFTYIEMNKSKGSQLYLNKEIQFSTLLFIFVFLIQKIQKNQLQLRCIFTDSIIEALLSIEIPDDPKIINSYQIIILFLMKNRNEIKKSMKKLILKSSLIHITHQNLSEEMSLILISFIKKSMTTYPEICMNLKNKDQFLSKLHKLALKIEDLKKLFIMIEVLFHFSFQHFTSEDFMTIYCKTQKQKMENNEKIILKSIKLINPKIDENEAQKLLAFLFSTSHSQIVRYSMISFIVDKISLKSLLFFCSEKHLLQEIIVLSSNEQLNEFRISSVIKLFERLSKENQLIYLSMKSYLRNFIQELEESKKMTNRYFKIAHQLRMISNKVQKVDIYLQ